ncbi:MAG: hypothetical protein ABIJ57_08675 [Pseudomonadota bacterium]
MEENIHQEWDDSMAKAKAVLAEGSERLYIGAKIIRAVPMSEETFLHTVKNQPTRADTEDRPGYKVIYPDGYISWSPKETFDTAYREVTPGERKLI